MVKVYYDRRRWFRRPVRVLAGSFATVGEANRLARCLALQQRPNVVVMVPPELWARTVE